MSARDDYPQLAKAWGTDTARALDEIDRLRAEVEQLRNHRFPNLSFVRLPPTDGTA